MKNRTFCYGILGLLLFLTLAASIVVGLLLPKDTGKKKTLKKERYTKEYDLPVPDDEREEAEADCREMMSLISNIYETADKGEALNVVLSDKTLDHMQDELNKTGRPVISARLYSNMANYRGVEAYLKDCMDGKDGSVIVYSIPYDGGISREKFTFDGTDMYQLSARAVWNDKMQPEVTSVSHTKIKEWSYTDKGWFCYKMCVPEPPEVTEVVDGNRMLRIKPMAEAHRQFSEDYLLPLGYRGSNLLRSDWDAGHLEDLDYTGIYEFLYSLEYGSPLDADRYAAGIPEEEFERIITEYLPVTREQLREYAEYDAGNRTYAWEPLGCSNYAPDSFGTSIPEVTGIRDNSDGTITLTVDAVCERGIADDAVMTHELTMRFETDGSFQYIGNHITAKDPAQIPAYQYRYP